MAEKNTKRQKAVKQTGSFKTEPNTYGQIDLAAEFDARFSVMSKEWPFDENKYIEELKAYITKCNTSGHYANAKKDIHTFHLISQGKDLRGLHYSVGTAMSYLDRFGSKGGYNRKDLLKTLHFVVFALYCYDNYGPENKSDKEVIEL